MSSPLSLLDILAEVPDPRHRRGIRHPLSAILGLAVLAMLSGCKSYQAIAPFGRDKGFALAQVLGFRRGKTPTKATYSILFRRLDVAAFEAALARWIARRLGDGETAVIAPDGKTRMRIINEPTAASLAYGLEKKKNEVIAVFDLGGSTFDISIFDVGDGVFEVLGVNGDTHLGGDNFDQVLIDYIAEESFLRNGTSLTVNLPRLDQLPRSLSFLACWLSFRNWSAVRPLASRKSSGIAVGSFCMIPGKSSGTRPARAIHSSGFSPSNSAMRFTRSAVGGVTLPCST